MTINRIIPLLILAFFLFSCSPSQNTSLAVSDKAMIIHNVQLIDVNTGSIEQKKAILIDSSMIKAIEPFDLLSELVRPENHIDAKNKYVIPGLWDMHVHLEGADLIPDNEALIPVFVAYGITTVRDAASDLGEQVLTWRDEINTGKRFGPQIFTAGLKLEGINSIWKGDLEIANEQELLQMLDKLDAYQVDFVKITENTLPGKLFLTSTIEAKKRGYLVSGHVPYDLTIKQLAEAGFSSIEHASHLLRLGSDEATIVEKVKSGKLTKQQAGESYLANFDQDRAIKAYTELAKTGVYLTPTLIGGKQLAYLDENDHQNDEFLQYLTKRFTDNYQWRISRMANDTPEQKRQRKERYQLISQQLPHALKAGITLLAGSDAAALNTYVYPAQSLHEELVLFQQAGLTPLQILQSATINGARFMGRLASLSTIDIGKEADLVILNKNPLADISATGDIFAVVNNGQYLNRSRLDSILQKARERRIELDKSRE